MKRLVLSLLLACFTLSLSAQENAADKKPPAEKKSAENEKEKEAPKDNIVTTSHTVTINGETIKYAARAGTMVMKDEDGKPLASFFFTAYTKDGADEAAPSQAQSIETEQWRNRKPRFARKLRASTFR